MAIGKTGEKREGDGILVQSPAGVSRLKPALFSRSGARKQGLQLFPRSVPVPSLGDPVAVGLGVEKTCEAC